MIKRKELTRCKGCGGTGKQKPEHPLAFPRDCEPCGGTGYMMMGEGDVWCVRCGGSGREKKGIPPVHRMETCSICGGMGFVSFF